MADEMAQMPPGSVKLNYKIIYCSGEDPNYPVTELLDPSVNSKGWQSQKFCQYPQEIIIQFPAITQINQLQFLSHQAKIANKIELFAFNPETLPGGLNNKSKLPLNEIQFTKMGYLTLNTNERSGFQARELKSVSVTVRCALLKILLHKCHLNSFNHFNQIGLIALNCIGPSGASSVVGIPNDNISQSSQHQGLRSQVEPSVTVGVSSQQDLSIFDPETQQKIQQLELDKVIAIQNENYDLAKQLKVQIDQLKSVGTQLQQLQAKKAVAIAQDDFDAAKRIKLQMDQLRYGSMLQSTEEAQRQMGPPQRQQPQTFAEPMPKPNQRVSYGYEKELQPSDEVEVSEIPEHMLPNQYSSDRNQDKFTKYDSMTEKQQAVSYAQMYGTDPNNQKKVPFGRSPASIQETRMTNKDFDFNNGREQLDDQRSEKQTPTNFIKQEPMVYKAKTVINVDDQVIPALNKNAGKGQPSEYASGQEFSEEELKEGEPIGNDKRAIAEPLIQVFGERTMRKIFSKTWALREEGLSILQDEILAQQLYDFGQAFIAALAVVRHTIGDKIISVCQRSITFLIDLCQQLDPEMSDHQRKELSNHTEFIVSNLVEKLGDNLAKVRQSSEEAILTLCNHQAFGPRLCIQAIIKKSSPNSQSSKGSQTGAKKTMNSSKLIIGKYLILSRILSELKQMQPDVLRSALPFTVQGLIHSLQDVRQPASRCMVELYKVLGEEVRQHFGELRPAQIEQLEAQLAEVGGQPKQRQQSPKIETIQTNINPKGANSKQGQKATKEPPKQERQEKAPASKAKNQPSPFQQMQESSLINPQFESQEMQPEDFENENVCNFCGQFDENFNQESIDIHYWKECPMLTTCWECEQVVEVSTLNEHLIEECQNSEKYKDCQKCVTVLLKEDFPGHYCLKPKPANAAKCPLCTSIIYPPNINGWKEHLMQDGCSGSNRLQPIQE